MLCVLWMTSTMRRNYELYGSYISLDFMKRGLNKLLWPYFAVCMYDDNMRLCLGAEGMLCGELNEMYAFAAWFMSNYAKKRLLSEVNVVAADHFLTKETVKQLGFVNAVFFGQKTFVEG